ncbi:hypothetical protein [Coleofasciculus sp. G3-WIS-01]
MDALYRDPRITNLILADKVSL